MNILIVDDNLELVKIIMNELNSVLRSQIDINVISSEGEEAIKYLFNTNFDVVLLDLQLPQKSGLEVLKQMEKLERKPEVIIMSGDTSYIHRLIVEKYAFFHILKKPFAMSELTGTLQKIIKKRSLDMKKASIILDHVLKEFNFNTSAIGYSYIISCFQFCLERGGMILPMEQGLYQKVADKYKVEKVSTVKWNIQKCISSMIRFTDNKVLQHYFGYTIKPTPKQFVMRMLEYIYDY